MRWCFYAIHRCSIWFTLLSERSVRCTVQFHLLSTNHFLSWSVRHTILVSPWNVLEDIFALRRVVLCSSSRESVCGAHCESSGNVAWINGLSRRNYGAWKLLEKSSLRVYCCSIAVRYTFTLALLQTDRFMGDASLGSTVCGM
jgi:hypothetical protein